MARINFRVDTDGVIEVPQLGRLLFAVNGLHVAAAIASRHGNAIAKAVHETGVVRCVQAALEAQRLDDATLLAAAAMINSEGVLDRAGALKLHGIHIGSVETVIEEWIEAILERFKRLLIALPSVARTAHSDQMASVITDLRRTAVDVDAFNVVVAVSAVNARVALDSMQKPVPRSMSEEKSQQRSTGA